MSFIPHGIHIADYAPDIKKVIAADTAIAGYIKYIGSAASGLITGDADEIAFTHGVAASEVADTTILGTVPGTIDYGTDAGTFTLLKGLIDGSPNWEFIYSGARPSGVTEITNVSTLLATAGLQCKPGGASFTGDANKGYPMYWDRSVSLAFGIGITNIGAASEIHNHDAGVYNMIRLVNGTLTFASGTHVFKIWEIDDKSETETQIGANWASAATTVKLSIPTGADVDGVVYGAMGKRLIVEQVSTTAEPTAWDFEVFCNSIVVHPAANAGIINPEFNA